MREWKEEKKNLPSIVWVTLDKIHGKQGVGSQEAEADKENTDQDDYTRELVDVLTGVSKHNWTNDTTDQGEDERDEMGLGLTTTTVTASVQVADAIGHVAAKEPHEGTCDDDGDDGEA